MFLALNNISFSLPSSRRPLPLASALSTPTMSRNNSLNYDDHQQQQQQTPNTSNCNTPPVPSVLPSSTPPRLMSPNQVPSTVELSGDGGEPISFPSAQLLSPRKATGRRTRQYYGQNSGYIMDAKTKGNVGRYINVSTLCSV